MEHRDDQSTVARSARKTRGSTEFNRPALSVDYLDHTAKTVTLYLEESFTFQVISPQAAVRLAYSDGKKK
jgi:hypothetical protein